MDWKLVSANASVVAGPAWSSRRIAVVSIAGAWTLYLSFVASRLAIIGFPREWLLIQRHFMTAAVGAALMAVLYVVLRQLEQAPIALRIAAAVLLAIPAAGLLSVVNYEFLYVIDRDPIWAGTRNVQQFRGIFARTVLEIYLVFVGWSALYTSVSSALQSQEALHRAAVAELKALRYQLNPHFLFNSLNTVSALVLRGDTEGAENTIQALSQFLRAALVPIALNDTTLEEEIGQQRLYLGIEQVRFGDRLRVEWSVPADLHEALLPPLLLQPLVENVIRHAVAGARRPVTMAVSAWAAESRLHIRVDDDGPGKATRPGHGIGLHNTASRLSTRFGEAGRCLSGPRPDGGFRVDLTLPLRLSPETV